MEIQGQYSNYNFKRIQIQEVDLTKDGSESFRFVRTTPQVIINQYHNHHMCRHGNPLPQCSAPHQHVTSNLAENNEHPVACSSNQVPPPYQEDDEVRILGVVMGMPIPNFPPTLPELQLPLAFAAPTPVCPPSNLDAGDDNEVQFIEIVNRKNVHEVIAVDEEAEGAFNYQMPPANPEVAVNIVNALGWDNPTTVERNRRMPTASEEEAHHHSNPDHPDVEPSMPNISEILEPWTPDLSQCEPRMPVLTLSERQGFRNDLRDSISFELNREDVHPDLHCSEVSRKRRNLDKHSENKKSRRGGVASPSSSSESSPYVTSTECRQLDPSLSVRAAIGVPRFLYARYNLGVLPKNNKNKKKITEINAMSSSVTCRYCPLKPKNNVKTIHLIPHLLINHCKVDANGSHSFQPSKTSKRICPSTTCFICGLAFIDGLLANHMEMVHQVQVQNGCQICEKDFPRTYADLINHCTECHVLGDMPYNCKLCHSASALRTDMMDHFEQQHSKEKQVLCPTCMLIFPCVTDDDMNQLESHLLKHKNVEGYVCIKCSLEFVDMVHFNRHITSDHLSLTDRAKLNCYKKHVIEKVWGISVQHNCNISSPIMLNSVGSLG